MSVAVRPAERTDAALIVLFIRELAEYERAPDAAKATTADIEEALFCEAPRVFALIAEADGEPVGFALYFYNFSTWTGRCGVYLEDLYVREQARGRGAGAAMFAAFPEWYATLFSGFYLPLLLILIALILRGVSFEYRHQGKSPEWAAAFDRMIVIGSAVPAFLWGVAFANIIQVTPIDADFEFTGTLHRVDIDVEGLPVVDPEAEADGSAHASTHGDARPDTPADHAADGDADPDPEADGGAHDPAHDPAHGDAARDPQADRDPEAERVPDPRSIEDRASQDRQARQGQAPVPIRRRASARSRQG